MSRKNTLKCEYSAFANNIKLLIKRDEHGKKQDFADAVGCSYETVRRWCNGENLPDGAQLLKINDIYEVSIDWLLTGRNAPTAEQGVATPCSKETQELCDTVAEILESPDKGTALALKMNIHAFATSLQRYDEIRDEREKAEQAAQKLEKTLENNTQLKADVEELKKAVGQLTKVQNLEPDPGADPGALSRTGEKSTLYAPNTVAPATVHEPTPGIKDKPNKEDK